MLLFRSVTSCLLHAELHWTAAKCFGIQQKWKPCVSAIEGSGLPELQQSRYARQKPVEVHTWTVSFAAMAERRRTEHGSGGIQGLPGLQSRDVKKQN